MSDNVRRKQGMGVGGVDPSILRELSGVYKPFIKAFKELISNAYDADASNLSVRFSDDFESATVADDGNGMNPFEFRSEFTRIGGSSRKSRCGKTPKGRSRIGNKGIGFLALARYCDRMIVSSSSSREFTYSYTLEKTPASIDIRRTLGIPIKPQVLSRYFTCEVRQANKGAKVAKSKYSLNWSNARLVFREDIGSVDILMSVDCEKLAFEATLDFSRLLKLADSADLEKLSDFTLIDVFETDQNRHTGTVVSIEGLKPFVKRELRADRRKGYVRNVASRSGFEQMVWHLSRCTPIGYVQAPPACEFLQNLLQDASPPTLEKLELQHGNTTEILLRPIYPLEADAAPLHKDMITPVEINENGLVAKGFLVGYESVVFPAEYRGVSIRAALSGKLLFHNAICVRR